MGLNWNLQDIENWEEKCQRENAAGETSLSATTEVLLFVTMSIGMHEITRGNCEEFFRRVMLYEEVYRPLRKNPDGEGVYFSFKEIEDHIGLLTNAAPFSKAKFKGVVLEALEQKAKRRVRATERRQQAKNSAERDSA